MKKNICLSVPNACIEKWENFSTTAHGGFCSSCTKEVIDFTTMSDQEIIHFFVSKPANACGRFRADQLKMYVPQPMAKVNPGFTLLKVGLLSLLLAVVLKPIAAQSVTEKPKTEVMEMKPKATSSSAETRHEVSGVVKSADDGSALAGVYVVVKGTTIGTITDAEGRFELKHDFKEGDVIIFSFVGLRTEEYIFSKQVNVPINVSMKMQMEIMGKVAVNEVYSAPPKGLQKAWIKVKNFF